VYIRTLAALGERCRLTHLCTSRPQNATLADHPVAVVSDWRELIRAACDAVVIATPPHLHAEMVEACVEAGKPCIVEKPLCLDVERAERLHRRIQASNTPVLVNHTYLFHPAYLALKQALEEAGEPIRVILSEEGGFGPFRTHTLTVSPVRFSTRYSKGSGEMLEGSPIEFVQGPLPMARVITYFADGLSGGDRSRFGTALACDVVRLLAQCDAAMNGDTASHGSHAIS